MGTGRASEVRIPYVFVGATVVRYTYSAERCAPGSLAETTIFNAHKSQNTLLATSNEEGQHDVPFQNTEYDGNHTFIIYLVVTTLGF
jgi:hypothetical protein